LFAFKIKYCVTQKIAIYELNIPVFILHALSNPLFLNAAKVLPSKSGEEQGFFVVSGSLLLLWEKKLLFKNTFNSLLIFYLTTIIP